MGVKTGRCVGLSLPPSRADYLEILQASTSWNHQRLHKDCFTYTLKSDYFEPRAVNRASGEGLRPIHTQHAVPMPFPCHAVPLTV